MSAVSADPAAAIVGLEAQAADAGIAQIVHQIRSGGRV
jgi:hypothetical protein